MEDSSSSSNGAIVAIIAIIAILAVAYVVFQNMKQIPTSSNTPVIDVNINSSTPPPSAY